MIAARTASSTPWPLTPLDYLGIPSNTRAKRIGSIYGLGNVLVVVLFIISWWFRHGMPEQPPTIAFVFSFVAIATASITAWLGGELVERLGVGVHDGANLDAPSSLTGPARSDHSAHTGLP